MNKSSTDFSFINIAKLIGIALVLYLHLVPPFPARCWINSFIMPLFFLISGFLFTIRDTAWKQLLAKKARTLLIPYLFFAAITLVFWYFVGRNFGDDSLEENHLSTYLWGTLLGIADKNHLGYNMPIWFLPSLFCAEVIFYFCRKMFRRWSGLVCCLSFGAGMLLKQLTSFRLPLGVDVSLFMLIFFYAGYELRKRRGLETLSRRLSPCVQLVLALFLGVLSFWISALNGANGTSAAVFELHFNHYGLFLAGAVSGSLSILLLSNIIPELPFVRFFGRNTIVLLGFHLMSFTLIKGLMVYVFHLSLDVLDQSYWNNALVVVCSFALLTPVIWAINRFAPFLLGRPKGIY